jgi:CDP-diacylglycerol--glycerol-3-phosphate 3-phosphatidyltransferase
MTLANKLSFLRVALSPVFFVVYLLPQWLAQYTDLRIRDAWTIPLLWLIFIISEITDMLDGMAARKRGEVSDFGKLFDPFADTLMQITVFLCFVIDRIFPSVLFLLVLYREFSILFIRNLMLKKGVAMGARISGKVKTVTYIIAAAAALLSVSLQRLAILQTLTPFVKIGAQIIFLISVILSLVSFFDYLSVYRKSGKQ